MEIETFLALAGVYGSYQSHKTAFKHFAARLAIMGNARHQLENDTMGGAEARHDQGKVKKPSLMGGAGVVAVAPEDFDGPADAIRAFDDDMDENGFGVGKSESLRGAESVVDIADIDDDEMEESPK